MLGIIASVVWLALALLASWLMPSQYSGGLLAWLVRALWLLLPLGLIWLGVWSAQALLVLRQEAEMLREMLDEMRGGPAPARAAPSGTAPVPDPAGSRGLAPARRAAPPTAAQPARPAPAETAPAPELTPTEMYFALNFPDGPDDREAIRCLRLALAEPSLARLIRAAQDVVTLLAGRGIYMDDLHVPETDPALWQRFSAGERGAAVAGLAVVDDAAALGTAAEMIASDEVFRDVAHHFLRQFDRMLAERAQIDDPNVLAVLAETRSGRAFILLAQVTGIIGGPEAPQPAGTAPEVDGIGTEGSEAETATDGADEPHAADPVAEGSEPAPRQPAPGEA
ncbi:hypothetical protein GL279_08985 [Paracoccus limosus]|uniref:Uncharacterized protein n=2 Tax=Paracoccus limosus TaxID=913252 RepID=A0A844H582_9RHOB|nr:hypothetical protein [Paracoccus limosus]